LADPSAICVLLWDYVELLKPHNEVYSFHVLIVVEKDEIMGKKKNFS